MLGSGSFAAQTLFELADDQDNVHLASDFGSLPQDSHDLLLEDVLEEDEELPGDQQEIGVGAEGIGDDTTDLDLSATGTTNNTPQYEALGNNYRVCGVYSPEPHVEVYCVRLNFSISELVYSVVKILKHEK